MNLDEQELFPCCYNYDNIITVGAINSQGNITDFSGYGKSVTVMAPGDNVKVILPENDTAYIEGTSVATAFVIATIAVLMTVNPKCTVSELKTIVSDSSTNLQSLKGLCSSEGYINLYNAICMEKENYED